MSNSQFYFIIKYSEEDDFIYYAAGYRGEVIKTTSLMCENEDYLKLKYGTLTSDEVMLSGAIYRANISGYLYNNVQNYNWWTLSYDYNNGHLRLFSIIEGALSEDLFDSENGVRPTITLIPETTISGGDGTKTNPYVIN